MSAAESARFDSVPVRMPVGGVVLCGGLSQRMGMDKALARIGERSLLERTIGTLAERTEWVGLACGAEPRYEEFGRPLLLDHTAGEGPLVGLRAAFRVQGEFRRAAARRAGRHDCSQRFG